MKPRTNRDDPETRSRPKVVLAVLGVNLVVIILAVLFVPSGSKRESQSDKSAQTAGAVEQSSPGTPNAVAQTPRPARIIEPSLTPTESFEEQWGVQITGMRLAMGGNGLDLRYKVLNPAKATNLLHLKELTFVIDQESGKTLPLPFQRENQTSQKLVAGKTYFALLSNKGQVVKSGSRVTVAIGNQMQRDVLVE